MADQVLPHAALAEHAEAIRKYAKLTVESVIKIGHHLTNAKKLVAHGSWLPWLEREFAWKEQTALNFMRVAELSKSHRVVDLDVPLSTLYLLAAPSTPTTVVEAVVSRSAQGDRLSVADVKEEIAKAKPVDRREDESRASRPAARRVLSKSEWRAIKISTLLLKIATELGSGCDAADVVKVLLERVEPQARSALAFLSKVKAALDDPDG